MIDPFEKEQFVFPLLFAFVCNQPEGCKVHFLSQCYLNNQVDIILGSKSFSITLFKSPKLVAKCHFSTQM
jgi:hypothetical protein